MDCENFPFISRFCQQEMSNTIWLSYKFKTKPNKIINLKENILIKFRSIDRSRHKIDTLHAPSWWLRVVRNFMEKKITIFEIDVHQINWHFVLTIPKFPYQINLIANLLGQTLLLLFSNSNNNSCETQASPSIY